MPPPHPTARILQRHWGADRINATIQELSTSSSNVGCSASSSRAAGEGEEVNDYGKVAKELEAGRVELEVDMRR